MRKLVTPHVQVRCGSRTGRVRRRIVGLSSVLVVGVGAACATAEDPGGGDIGTSTTEALSGSEILSRAQQWVNAELQYCQSPNGASDTIDPSCSPVCNRQSNPDWDPYRSDCSGFIAWSWALPAPGPTTDGFAPASTTVSNVIDGNDLEPGDALNLPGDHIVLFVSWQTVGSVANFYEEPGCSSSTPYAHAFTSSVTINGSSVAIAYEGNTFTAIRYNGFAGAGDAGPSTPADMSQSQGNSPGMGGGGGGGGGKSDAGAGQKGSGEAGAGAGNNQAGAGGNDAGAGEDDGGGGDGGGNAGDDSGSASQDSGSQDGCTQDASGSQDGGSQDGSSQDSGSQDSGSQDSGSQDGSSQDSQDASGLQDSQDASGSQDSGSQDSQDSQSSQSSQSSQDNLRRAQKRTAAWARLGHLIRGQMSGR